MHDDQSPDGTTPPPVPGVPPTLEANASEESRARYWLAHIYQADRVPQLTPRAIISGMGIGAIMSISNLYVGLKTGWGLGVTITACIIAYAVFRFLEAIIPAYRRRPFSILENNTMSSAASAAGYIATASMASAIPALYMTTGRILLWWELMVWVGAVASLGVFMAIPLKRQMINIDQLPFPSGTATAETLKAMHSSGMEALSKARSLLWSSLAGAVLAFWKDGLVPFAGWLGGLFGSKGWGQNVEPYAFPDPIPLYPAALPLYPAAELMKKYTFGFEGSLIMVAAGAIMGIRVGVSLLVGAVLCYGVIAPVLIEKGIVEPGYRNIVKWTLWPSTALMVTSGLLSFALRWRTVLRAFSGLGSMLGRKKGTTDPLAAVEVPGSWFAVGFLVTGAACVVLGHLLFDIAWWMGVLAVLMTFLLSIVAARATGETDVTPIGAMGKITQLFFGVVAPTNITTNLMTAQITAGAASHSADLLTDVKSGYLLGANPRSQTIAQLFGVLAGVIFCVPIYLAVVDPAKLGGTEMPAPSAKVWASVAEMLSKGLDELPAGALAAMIAGAVVGVVLTLCEEFLPTRVKSWLPSPTGLGIAGVIPAFNSISMFLGALIAWVFAKSSESKAERYTVSVSSGLIAGESLMAVAIILIMQGPALVQAIRSALFGG